MATTKYVDGVNGNNSNDGSSWVLAKKTIVGARAVTAAGDLVLIAPGVYKEPNQNFASASDVGVLYMPDPTQARAVIVDFENRPGENSSAGIYYNWRCDQPVRFLNIMFRNPYSNSAHSLIGTSGEAKIIHCVLYQRNGTANTGMGVAEVWGGNFYVVNCTFYNLQSGMWGANVASPRTAHNYFVSVTTPFNSTTGTHDYNAYPGNTETHGINTSTGANPGLRDPANEDFRLDPVTTPADYETFMSAGLFGYRLGANGRGGLYYNPDYEQLRYLTPDPLPSGGNPQPLWENEGPNGTNTYTDGTPGDIIENSTTKELEIDLATTPGATGGRVRSDVMDLGNISPNLDELALGASEDLPGGAAIDIDNTLPQRIEYRSSNTAFAKGDPSPSWVAADRFGEYVNQGHRYFQIRVTFRTDHTNA